MADADRDEDQLATRDRVIFAESVQSAGRASSGPEKVRLWLDARRAAADGPAAGGRYRIAARALAWGLFVAGLIAGAGLAAGLLFFHGGRPISVTVFFAATVVWQLALWLALAGALIFWGRPVGGWAAGALGWLLARLGDSGLASNGERRASFAAVWGALRAKRMIYGGVLAWPVVIPAQIFAVALNLGILAATLGLVAISNRAFGWETTLNPSSETILRIVGVISWPWSALPQAHPSLEEIAGSRIVDIGERSYDLAALRSWWPFLVYAVAFYCLLPRLVLLGVSAGLQRRALARLDFRQADCARLLRRMDPVVVAGAAPPERAGESATAATAGLAGGEAVAIVSHELKLPADRVAAVLAGLGLAAGEVLEAEVDCVEANAEMFARLRADGRTAAVLLDGSRPPVKAILAFLRRLREARGERAEIVVILVTPGGAFDYEAAWRAAAAAQADPFLRVERT